MSAFVARTLVTTLVRQSCCHPRHCPESDLWSEALCDLLGADYDPRQWLESVSLRETKV